MPGTGSNSSLTELYLCNAQRRQSSLTHLTGLKKRPVIWNCGGIRRNLYAHHGIASEAWKDMKSSCPSSGIVTEILRNLHAQMVIVATTSSLMSHGWVNGPANEAMIMHAESLSMATFTRSPAARSTHAPECTRSLLSL